MKSELHSDSEDVDVLIIGAGPAGCAASIELVQAGLTVEMIERVDASDREHAAETLSSEIAPLLTRLGVWEQFCMLDQLPCFGMRASWSTADFNVSSSMVSPYGHGWHVNRRRFDALLAERAKMMGVTVHQQARGNPVRRENGSMWQTVIECDSVARRISARFLVDATGRTSPLRAHLGATDHVHDNLVGVGAWFESEANTDNDVRAALIEAAEQGWWYCAPTSDAAQRIAIFMTDLDLYRQGRSNSDSFWQQRMHETEHVQALLHGTCRISPVRTYIASSHQVLQLGQSGWLPVGDALQSVDPLSGRGVANAIQSGIDAAAAIAGVFEGRLDVTMDYLRSSHRSFSQYLVERLEIYGMEDRWHESTFWRRRTTRPLHVKQSRNLHVQENPNQISDTGRPGFPYE